LGNGKNPFRTPQHSWRAVFDELQWPYPIPSAEGEEWKRRRKVLAENFLAEKNAIEYFGLARPIARKFVNAVDGHLHHSVGDGDGDGNRLSVPLKSIVGNYALESVMKTVAGVDMDALSTPLPANALAFVKAVETMFTLTDAVEYNMWHAYFKTPTYVRLREAWRTMMQFPIDAMQPVFAEYAATGTLPASYHHTILPQLLAQYESGALTMDEVHGIAAAAVAAAVDTSAQTFEYLVYNLATNPDKQEILYDEIRRVIGPPSNEDDDDTTTYDADQYNSLEYLKATVKESMRLTPTIGAHVRTLQDPLEVPELLATALPTGSTVLINYYAITRNPELYPDPDAFLPERFLKSRPGCPYGVKDPYAAIPFGHGPRKCTGKAFAELNIKLGLLELLQRFRVSYDGPPLQQVERSLLRPTFPLEFTYHPRF
jgi:cytochrome P450